MAIITNGGQGCHIKFWKETKDNQSELWTELTQWFQRKSESKWQTMDANNGRSHWIGGNIGGHRKLVLTSVYLLSFYSSVHLNLNLLHFFCLLILFHDYYNIYYREKDIAHTAQGQDNYFYSNSNFSWPIQWLLPLLASIVCHLLSLFLWNHWVNSHNYMLLYTFSNGSNPWWKRGQPEIALKQDHLKTINIKLISQCFQINNALILKKNS
jgi:hypothetical protein